MFLDLKKGNSHQSFGMNLQPKEEEKKKHLQKKETNTSGTKTWVIK